MRDLAYGVPGAYNSLRRRPILISARCRSTYHRARMPTYEVNVHLSWGFSELAGVSCYEQI
jgi:hypothetical protein